MQNRKITDIKHGREITIEIAWTVDMNGARGRQIEIRHHRRDANKNHLTILDEKNTIRFALALLSALDKPRPRNL